MTKSRSTMRWLTRAAVVVALAVLFSADAMTPVRAAALTADQLLAEATAFAERTRDTGPVFVDPTAAVPMSTDQGDFIAARAHDYRGWFVVFARLGDRPLVGYLQADGEGLSGAGARVSRWSGKAGEAVPASIPIASTAEEEPFVDEILEDEEESCENGFALVASMIDCWRFADCTPLPGPLGTASYFGAPYLCKASIGKGLTWWSGQSVEYRESYTYNALNQHPWFTEIADWDYESQGCAPRDTVQAWNENMPGSNNDLDYSKCYDFRYDGPRPRVVIYTITVHWSDGIDETARYYRSEWFISGLWYHDHSLMTPNHYVQSMEMVESLGPNQFVGSYRFGRAFRDWHYQRCTNPGGCPT